MGDSHSDSEIDNVRPSFLDLKPKHTLKYFDSEEPKEGKTGKKDDPLKNVISFTFSIPDIKSSKKKGGLEVIEDKDEDSDDSDSTWYPPPHPKSKERKKKQKEKKPKEERWSYWKKQLPEDIQYCDDEIKYFMKQSLDSRKKFIDDEKDILKEEGKSIPPRFKFLNMKDMDSRIRLMIIKKIDDWYAMDPSQSDYGKMTNWISTLDKIPFGSYAPSIHTVMKEQKTHIIKYIQDTKKTMDRAVFGHEQAKEQILELIARDYSNPSDKIAPGTCIGIQGPAGNGKTTLIKDGISKALNRPFCLIGLGGAKNSSSFVGHDYTYEGGTYGRIVHALIVAQVMNPIIYFDELDKLSEDSQGEEIANLLCHLTDPSQNKLFEDKYLSGVPIDLSRVMFIFSFNHESKINPILKDRIQMIRTEGLTSKQKLKIVHDYILPEVYSELPTLNLKWDDSVISHIIDNYTGGEKGVRNLKRAIYSICRKLNLHLLMNDKKEDDSPIKLFTDPIIPSKTTDDGNIRITKKMVEEYLKGEVKKQILHCYI